MSELAFASATKLATKIQNKEISAVELLNFFLARADAHNSELNAIVVDLVCPFLVQVDYCDCCVIICHEFMNSFPII